MAGLVVITRPIEDAQDYAAELQAEGFQTFIEPMLAIEPVAFDAADLLEYDGVLVTSANAVHAYQRGGGEIAPDIPVYCVGKHSAKAARDAGFQNVSSVDGVGVDLLAHVLALPNAASQRFLHICGRHVAFPLVERLCGEGVQSNALVVYDAVQTEKFTDRFFDAVRAGDIAAVTFFSKRTAEAFISLARESDSGSLLGSIKSLSISSPVVECVRVLPWRASYVSKTPDRAGMMQLLTAYVHEDET